MDSDIEDGRNDEEPETIGKWKEQRFHNKVQSNRSKNEELKCSSSEDMDSGRTDHKKWTERPWKTQYNVIIKWNFGKDPWWTEKEIKRSG